MKSYAIYDEELQRTSAIGYLFCYEKAESFIVELCEDLDEWDAPLLFQGLVKRGIYTIPRDISILWVRERVIPSGRQNIGSILKNHKLKEYSEMAFFQLSKGKCSQDGCYITEISEEQIPEKIRNRRMRNIRECFFTEDRQLVCMLWDNTVRKVDLTKISKKNNDIAKVLKYKEIYDSVMVGPGGYSVIFNETIEIGIADLMENGLVLSLSANDFYSIIRNNVVDTSRACEMLQCSRQNLSYLVKENKLTPIICGTKENWYTKGELARVMSE